jgi:hypothetical protein
MVRVHNGSLSVGDLSECCLELIESLADETKTLSRGPNRADKAFRFINSLFGAGPRARCGHYLYGILHLIQQYCTLPLSEDLNHKIVRACLRVAEGAPYTFLQCKAFEVVAKVRAKPGMEKMVDQMRLERSERGSLSIRQRRKMSRQWIEATQTPEPDENAYVLLLSNPCYLTN